MGIYGEFGLPMPTTLDNTSDGWLVPRQKDTG